MSITTVLFDLDGTLLPMDQDLFIHTYFKKISTRLAKYGYDPTRLIRTIWDGTEAMIKNDGQKKNVAVFWDYVVGEYGDMILKDKHHFDKFYVEEFDSVKEVCGYNPDAASTVRRLKDNGYRVVLATNPVFPSVATEWRIKWAGLSPDDFELYATYENSYYCKPHPEYYKGIANSLGVTPEECLMVGNDVGDDMVAEKVGMKVFLLTDCLINGKHKDISVYPNGGFSELQDYIQSL